MLPAEIIGVRIAQPLRKRLDDEFRRIENYPGPPRSGQPTDQP